MQQEKSASHVRNATEHANTSMSANTTEHARNLTGARRLGYTILPGNLFSYILHLRPAEWPIMAAHTTVGLLLATGIPPAIEHIGWSKIALGLALWVICLNGGTLAINSAFDDDEGDIAYLAAPPKPPRFLAAFSSILMILGQIGAFFINKPFAIVYALCFAMSILYSVPPFRLKATAGADWIINMWGFGTLTAFAGWAISGRPLELWAVLLFLGFCPLFAGLYPLTQISQLEEDRARGDRTLALTLGVQRSLQIAIAATVLAFATFTAAAFATGAFGFVAPANPLWIAALAIPLAAWMAVLLPWYQRHHRMNTAQHQKWMYAALHAWAITDIVILVVFTR
jgi:4-hydroxybenzoate polyprenyltransferase